MATGIGQGGRQRGRPRRSERDALTRERVVEAALDLLDREGAAALTMRRLATHLGIEAMSLYAHVRNKDDLLDAVADRVALELECPEVPREQWAQRIRAAVFAWERMQRAHPGGFPLLYRRRHPTDRETWITEEIMDALAVAGFTPPEVALAYQTLISFLDGALLHWPRQRWQVAASWTWVSGQADPAVHPRVAAVAPHAARLAWDDVFALGVDLLLSGLENRLHAPQ